MQYFAWYSTHDADMDFYYFVLYFIDTKVPTGVIEGNRYAQ